MTNAIAATNCMVFLSRLLLDARTSSYPASQKLRIVFHQVQRNGHNRCEKYGKKNPCLPVVESPCRKEQQGREGDREPKKAAEGLFVQRVHPSNSNVFGFVQCQDAAALPPALLICMWRPLPRFRFSAQTCRWAV